MSARLLFSALLACAAPATAQESCAVCHGKEARELRGSIHVRGGVTCVGCHGGTSDSFEVEEAHGADLRSLRGGREAVEACGGCHSDVERMRAFGLRTDQLSLYWTSRHGAALAADPRAPVATCTQCHGAHGVLSASDPRAPIARQLQADACGACHADEARMAPHGIDASVVAQFRGSVHGQSLLERGSAAAPTCSDCHGSHGAAPPRVADVAQVCGNCHSKVQEFFAESAHARAPEGPDRAVPVQCVACHSAHAVEPPSQELFLGDGEGHCGACHAEGDAGMRVASELFEDVETLAATIGGAEEAVRAADRLGMFLGAERGYLDEARGLLVRSRSMTHALSPQALEDILNRGNGMVGQTLDGLATKRRVFRDRKIYTGIFLGISLAFALVLRMYGAELRARVARRGAGPR